MKITPKQLQTAAERKIITQEQAEQLLAFLLQETEGKPIFDITHILYYMGGLIAIGAMTLFMDLGWETFGGWGIVAISLLYMALGLLLTRTFGARRYPIPAGICATFVVALAPLAIYGLQQGMGWWPANDTYRDFHRLIRYHWIFMELGTLAVGAIVTFFFRYPFLQMPIAATLWYMSMDLAPLLTGGPVDFELRSLTSLYFGLAMLLFALWVDIRSSTSKDYAFWLYLFGIITFWGGLTTQDPTDELSRFFYFLINLFLIGVGAALVRRVFVIFGALGCTFYLGHLANTVFKDSWFFPFALTLIGLAIIYLGILWQKNEQLIIESAQAILPQRLQELLRNRRHSA